jgi:hypothetical protein
LMAGFGRRILMPEPAAEYHEVGSDVRVEAVPLTHLSVEVGHFYAEDLAQETASFDRHFRRIARWVDAVQEIWCDTVPDRRLRMSTCLLIDDCSMPIPAPPVLLPALLNAAENNNLKIDYVARESGCAAGWVDGSHGSAESGPDGGISLAELVEARLVDDPPPNTTAAHPPARQTGWLSNGQRSPVTDRTAAMKAPSVWRPPRENAASKHSIFLDVELWNGAASERRWSCAMLAAVWQLLRLGLLRYHGRAVAVPQSMPDFLPEVWERLPVVTRVNPNAEPFSAYQTLTICAQRYLATEHAVRTVLDRVAVDPAALEQVRQRSSGEGITLPPTLVDRLEYLFVQTGPVRGVDSG